MNPLTLSDITVMCGGKLLAGNPAALSFGICIDSRKLVAGDLFVALKGDKTDGHQYIAEAASKGASACIVDNYHLNTINSYGIILVTDVLAALQNLARNYRYKLSCKVVGVTGSNGKTSVKDLTAAVLASNYAVSKTQDNLNNHLGLPLSVLGIDSRHQMAVLEMGMNHPGEIAPLAAIAAPDVAIITNIGQAHIEYMGSREAIAKEKCKLAESVGSAGTVILNASDDFTDFIRSLCQCRVVTSGIGKGDVQISNIENRQSGSSFKISYQSQSASAYLPILGRHMVCNAAMAVAAGLVLGVTLIEAVETLKSVQLSGGRLQTRQIAGYYFLDDSYNANPDSMTAALETLLGMPCSGRKIAVLGAMGELGTYSEYGHRRVGRAAVGLDMLIVVGENAKSIADEAYGLSDILVVYVRNAEEAGHVILKNAHSGDCILVKGSRSARMEKVIEVIQNTTLAV